MSPPVRRAEAGYTLVELLTVLTIFTVVMTTLVSLFVQGSNAQLDLNRRFEAQQGARVALDKLRREVHCAQGGTTLPAGTVTSMIQLDMPGQCPSAVNGQQTNVRWCAVQVASGRYALYRKLGTTCDTAGVQWADNLTTASVFQYQAPTATNKARLYVSLLVDVDPGDAVPAYRLCDQITLRNTRRTGAANTPLPPC